MERTLALAASLILAAILAWLHELPPRVAPLNAAAERFSAARAMEDIRVIAAEPHPTGSAANARVRDHLVRRMTELGLSPQVQRTAALATVQRPGGASVTGGMVENVIGVLPGRDRQAPAVALMAHYDSVPGSPGAADDAAGVAAALEIARAMKARGPTARDVILIMTDGEEAGLLGARAFFDEHPLAKRVGFLLNMEARGGGGRAQMFQTGADNGETIALFQRSAERPVSSSLAVFLYENMPNDTDFTIAREAGVAGLNYAFIGRQFDYHSPTSTPETLQKRSVQDMGRQVLAATAEAAGAPALPAPAPNLVYAHAPLAGVIAYPAAVGWAVLGGAAALLGLALWRARRAGALAWRDVLQGAGAAIYLVSTAAVLLRLARRATGAEFGFMEQRVLLAQAVRYEAALVLIALGVALYAAAALARGGARRPAAALALGAGVLCSAFGDVDPIGLGLGLAGAILAFAVLGRAAATAGAWAGVLATGLAAAIVLQVLAPATAFLVAWPLALAALAAAISALGAVRRLWITLAIVLLATPGLAWLGGFAHGLFLGLDMPELLAPIAWLAAFLIWPLAHPRLGGAGRITALVVLAIGLALIVQVRFDPPWSERRPQATLVAYDIDTDTGRSERVSAVPHLTPWSRTVLEADGGTITRRRGEPPWRGTVDAATAAPVPAIPARAVLEAGADGGREVRVTPPPGARLVVVRVKTDQALSAVRINGRPAPILDEAGSQATIRWIGAPADMTIRFDGPAKGSLVLRHAAVIERWPAAKAPPPRPEDEMAFDLSDSTVVRGTTNLPY
jgi:hypothetical protein